MSHWIEPPELIDTVSGRTLLAFVDTTWSLAVATWRSDTEVAMTLRKYPGDHAPSFFEVLIDCEKGTAVVGSEACNLASLEQVLARACVRSRQTPDRGDRPKR